MSLTWNAATPPDIPPRGPVQWLRVALRGVTLVFCTYFGMIFVLAFNVIERWLPLGIAIRIIRLWGWLGLTLCGLRLERRGTPMAEPGAIVANHSTWIDIFTLLTADEVYFVSKADVARWPVVGILSRQIGTIYIERRRTAARQHQDQLEERLLQGDRICFFPEGTSTDGQRVLPFRSTLFAAFTSDGLRDRLWVQPVSVIYRPNGGLPPEFYGWWGEMGLGGHIASVFARSKGARVDVLFHAPLRVADYRDRKALAAVSEEMVRQGVETGQVQPAPTHPARPPEGSP